MSPSFYLQMLLYPFACLSLLILCGDFMVEPLGSGDSAEMIYLTVYSLQTFGSGRGASILMIGSGNSDCYDFGGDGSPLASNPKVVSILKSSYCWQATAKIFG